MQIKNELFLFKNQFQGQIIDFVACLELKRFGKSDSSSHCKRLPRSQTSSKKAEGGNKTSYAYNDLYHIVALPLGDLSFFGILYEN